jgi:signal peptidase I
MSKQEQITGSHDDMPETSAAETETEKKSVKNESWGEVIKTIVYALLIAGVIRSLLFQPFNIPSASMEATLLEGDYLFVSKFSYGYSRYSFPFGMIPFSGRILASEPERGDVVVFKNARDGYKDYIKRVIGLPGDRIQMRDGVLYINDEAIPKVATDPYVEYRGSAPHPVDRYIETLPNGKSYPVLDRLPNANLDDTEVFLVPEGHYFMMGDNRDNSDDSRQNVSYVPFENLVGKAQIIFFSTDGSARYWEIWNWPFAVRYDRLFKFVE